MLFSLIYQTRLTSLARKCLCVSEFLKPRAAKGEHAVLVSGWLTGGWAPGLGTPGFGAPGFVVAGFVAPGFGVAGSGVYEKSLGNFQGFFGGSRGSRTPDPLLVRQML